MLLEARDWEPARDLSFGFNAMRGMRLIDVSPSSDSPPPPQAARCPKAVELWERGRALAELNDSASPAEPSELDVARFAREGIGDPRICRNFVFAVYGRRFEDDALNRHFYGDGGFVPGSWPYAPFEPNPDFSEAALTVGDWNTLRLIDAVERRLAQAAPSSAAPSSPARSRPALVAAPPADAPPLAPATPRARGCGIARLTSNAAPGDLLLPCFALWLAAVRAAKRRGRCRRWARATHRERPAGLFAGVSIGGANASAKFNLGKGWTPFGDLN